MKSRPVPLRPGRWHRLRWCSIRALARPKSPLHPIRLVAVDTQKNIAPLAGAVGPTGDHEFLARAGHRKNIVDARAADDLRATVQRCRAPGRVARIRAARAIEIPRDDDIAPALVLPGDFGLEHPPGSSPIVAALREVGFAGPGPGDEMGVEDRKIAVGIINNGDESRGADLRPRW